LLSDEVVSRLREQLPQPPQPQGSYAPAAVGPGLVVTAGMTPRVDGDLVHTGRVGIEVTLDEARDAASIALDNALSAVLTALGAGRRLDQVLRLTVYVACGPDFTDHTAVADGASARLHDLLDDRGVASRTAVGVASLPGGACVELELTATWVPAGTSDGA
jgi:enamine deaminase RidA (YjgF/YER057c/UK114 family)